MLQRRLHRLFVILIIAGWLGAGADYNETFAASADVAEADGDWPQ